MPRYTRRQLLPLMLATLAAPHVAIAQPAPYRAHEVGRAIRRGMQYLQSVGNDSRNFRAFGHDVVWTFLDLARTVDPEVSKRGRGIGQDFAQRWLKDNPRVPADVDARTLGRLCAGSFACHQIGVPSPRLKEEIGTAVKRFNAVDFFKFDPAKEPVPGDLPEICGNCGTQNQRGQLQCVKCGAPVKLANPWDTLSVAMIEIYVWERYGLPFPSTMVDICQHLPRMRPYRGFDNGRNAWFEPISLAITHVVYVFNDYFTYRLKPEWLPEEYEYLRANLTANLATGNTDLMGEYLDSLRSFGMPDADPLIRTGIDFLLARQNDDGSWSQPDQSGDFTPFHATSTAVNGLSEFAHQGEKALFPEALRRAYGK